MQLTPDMLNIENGVIRVDDFHAHPLECVGGLCEQLADMAIQYGEQETGKTADFHGIDVTPDYDDGEMTAMLAREFPRYLAWGAEEVFGEGGPVEFLAIDNADEFTYRVNINGPALMSKYLDIMGDAMIDDGYSTSGFYRTCDNKRWALHVVLSHIMEYHEIGYFEFCEYFYGDVDDLVTFPAIEKFFNGDNA